MSPSTVAMLTLSSSSSSSSSIPGDNVVPDSPPDSISWLDPGAGLTPDLGDQVPALRVFVITVGVLAVYNAAVRFVGGGQRPGPGPGGNAQIGGGGADGYDPRKYSVGFVSTTTAPGCRKRRDRREEEDEVMLGNMDHISEFVDLDRVAGDVTRPSRSTDSGTRSRGGSAAAAAHCDEEYDFARFEYVEDVTRLRDSLVGGMKGPVGDVLQYPRMASL
ncbi:hypothetical protein DHEL01_v208017 [Diaporthe helianthi]|uniref:Uncharacterized protein n=1 Tax=Diaporthe helianthi TaxID=158607 RepID=A0A2P5HTK4_DIAHE|nr:hypothetical protein DHEL01_v208017 [Diaporthe helianthi]